MIPSRASRPQAPTCKRTRDGFKETDPGRPEAKNLTDFLVLDRNCLAVHANEIKEISPVMTVAGGRAVFGL